MKVDAADNLMSTIFYRSKERSREMSRILSGKIN